jgi:hypothetical protein
MRNRRSITWWIAVAPTRRRLQNAIRAITPSSGTGGSPTDEWQRTLDTVGKNRQGATALTA